MSRKSTMRVNIVDNLLEFTLACDYTLSGPVSKRKLQMKLHKKKCDICSKVNYEKQAFTHNTGDMYIKEEPKSRYIHFK